MAKTSNRSTSGVTFQNTSSSATRVDPAHVIPMKTDESMPASSSVEPASSNQLAELQQQAAELAAHLQSRQSDVERREADFNARMAEMDTDIRRARLWLDGRQNQLEEREASLQGRDQAQELRLERVISAETLLNTTREKSRDQQTSASADLDRHQLKLDEQKLELSRQQRESEFKHQQFQQWQADRIGMLRRLEANIHRHRASVDQAIRTEREHSELVAMRERRARRRVVELKRALRGLEDRLQQVGSDSANRLRPEEIASGQTGKVLTKSAAANTAIEDSLRAELSAVKTELESRCRRVEQLKAELSSQKEIEGEFERLKSRVAEDRRHADEADRLITEERQQLQAERAQLDYERLAIQQETEASRKDLLQQREHDQAQLAARHQRLEQMDQQISDRSAAIEQMRDSLRSAQQEAMEMRLATEEVWTQLSGRVPPAMLTQTLAEVRAKLADHYRLASESLDEKRQEVDRLSGRLGEQLARLKDEKTQLHQWARRREGEIELQAARLVAREQQLDQQEAEHRDLNLEHQAQHREDRAEIRRLLSQLRGQKSERSRNRTTDSAAEAKC